jgi:septal ring factor EnvC (AmiA/AmiB activator)
VKWIVGLAIVALAGAGVYFAYAASENRDTAERWQDRAGRLERTVTARTRQLNSRTDALNRTAAALKRSEADVRTLERRQRELANEKAQVEDARGALAVQAGTLASLADAQRQCTAGLGELLNRFAADDTAWVAGNAGTVEAACDDAAAKFAAFQTQYGG